MSDLTLFELPDPEPPAGPAGAADPAREAVLQTAASAAAAELAGIHARDDDPWLNSRYAWLKALPPVTRSRAAAAFAETVLRGLGYPVAAGPGAADRIVNGQRITVKLSTLWANGTGEYRFQSLGGEARWTVLVGVSPDQVHMWLVATRELAASGPWLVGRPTAMPAPAAGCGGPLTRFEQRCTLVLGPAGAPHGPAAPPR